MTVTCCASPTPAAAGLETEFGSLDYRPGDWIYLPKACTWRQLPDTETTWLMISATDEVRVPPPGPLGRHFPFDPTRVVIPRRRPTTTAMSPRTATGSG